MHCFFLEMNGAHADMISEPSSWITGVEKCPHTLSCCCSNSSSVNKCCVRLKRFQRTHACKTSHTIVRLCIQWSYYKSTEEPSSKSEKWLLMRREEEKEKQWKCKERSLNDLISMKFVRYSKLNKSPHAICTRRDGERVNIQTGTNCLSYRLLQPFVW